MGLPFSIFGKDALIAKFKNAANSVSGNLLKTMTSQMAQTADYARSNKLSGNPLNRRSGDLSRSVAGRAEIKGNKIVGFVYSKGVKYAYVHEIGGTFTIPSHERIISMVFGKSVPPHAITVNSYTANYPQRAFLRPSLLERENEILDALRNTVKGALK